MSTEKKVVVLFHPRTFHERNYRYFHVPYSLLSVASMIDRRQFDVLLWDNNLLSKDDFASELASIGDSLFCIGISSMIGHQITDGLAFAKQVRQSNSFIPIIWGGPMPTVLPDLSARHELVDIVVIGQGQYAFRELLDALLVGKTVDQVQGIVHKRENRSLYTERRPYVGFDAFPPFRTVFDLIDPGKYIRSDEHIATRTISYHSSQGCSFNCGFCSEVALWHHRWGGFSPEKVLNDITWLVDNYSINGIKFFDAEFFIDQRRVFSIARGMIDRGLNLRWGAAVHPANLGRLTDEELDILRRSGASRLLIGAESGVQEELVLIGKRSGRDLLLHQARRCSENDISASFTFVTGYPGMPSENITRTLEFAGELASYGRNHEAKVHFFAPYPGTPLYDVAIKSGFVPPNTLEEWSTYDYYDVVTPWVEHKWESVVREFNEGHYPYLGTREHAIFEQPKVKICPLLR